MTNANDSTRAELEQADLESRLAFQEETLSQLNQMVANQDQRIVHLEQQLQALAGHYRSLRDAVDEAKGLADGTLSDERPPHY